MKIKKFARILSEIFKSRSAGVIRSKNASLMSATHSEMRTNGKKTVIAIKVNDWKREFLMNSYPEYNWIFLGFKARIASMSKEIYALGDVIVLVWGYNEYPECLDYIQNNNLNLCRVEDGFIRSVELGANHALPMSLVFDDTGTLYFDSRKPSALEQLIVSSKLIESERLKSIDLIRRIQDSGLSKYNSQSFASGKEYYDSFGELEVEQKRVLVVGQVEDDASIKYGGCGNDNGSLVDKARLDHPDAQIFFKPHPDVLAGKRAIRTPLDEISKQAHVIDNDMSLASSFDGVDEVYVISSLSGFEALLHGKKVTVMGQPFYSGWGLTNDVTPLSRRISQQVNLPKDIHERLVHIFGMTYLKYPDYFNTTAQCKSDITHAIDVITKEILPRKKVSYR